MLTAQDSHIVNCASRRTCRSHPATGTERRRVNLFNVGAYTGFLSADARSLNFGLPTNYVPARVGQGGLRLRF
jgi:hypothetical protein